MGVMPCHHTASPANITSLAMPQNAMSRPDKANSATSARTPTDQSTPIMPLETLRAPIEAAKL
jgi:hypothetical protein